MKWFDKYLQRQRLKKAKPYIFKGCKILDIGADTGSIFSYYNNDIAKGFGFEPSNNLVIANNKFIIFNEFFPGKIIAPELVDVVTILAVLEHIPSNHQKNFVTSIRKWIKPKGYVIVTVPDKKVDYIIFVFKKLGLMDGMKTEEHHGFDTKQTALLFAAAGFTLVKHSTFQFGLNNLFIFQSNI